MINVSNEFKKQLAANNRNYLEYADIILKDGTILNLTNKNLWNGGLSIEDAVSSDNSFDIGAAIINKCTLTINNIYDEFSDYVFEDAEVIASVGLELPDGTTEKIRKGTYVVDEPSYNGSIITLSCLDNMRKFDRSYSESKLIYPVTLNAIVRDACSVCGVTLQTINFLHDDFVIQTRPTDEATTFREVISWAAQIAGCFCRCDVYGHLELKWYNQKVLEKSGLDGGYFDSDTPYSSGDDADGGAFSPWNTGYVYDAGTFSDFSTYHHIYSIFSNTISTDDVVITGVKVVEKNESEDAEKQLTTYQSGTDGYVISIEDNELIKNGAGQTVAGWLGEQLIGFRFRKANINHLSDPTIEAGDVAFLTDRKQNTYGIIISSAKFSTGSSQNTVSAAENPARNSAARYLVQTKNYVEWRKAIEKEKTEREKALEALGERLENSPGVFTTVETQADGSKIYYLHNKPNLSESDVVWKMTAEAWGVSTDGGKTWNAGMTVDGDTIVRILTATGVNADWINTGQIAVKDSDGNITFLADVDTGQVIINAESISIGGMKIADMIATGVDGQSQEYVFNKLTNNGKAQGLSLINGQLYISFSYAKGGTLKLGGTNNVNGELHVYNASESEVGRMDKSGLYAIAGTIGGFNISSTKIYGTSTSGKTVVMQKGTNDNNAAFAAGGSNHSNYSDCPFRVRMNGELYSSGGTFEDVTIKNGSLDLSRGDYETKLTSNGLRLYLNDVSVEGAGNEAVSIAQSTSGSGMVGTYDTSGNSCSMSGGDLSVGSTARVKKLYVNSVEVTGTKSRIINTNNYGTVHQYCYEMPSPTFGDIGSGTLDENGTSYIFFDDIFAETVNSGCKYYVFLQKEGDGDLWIEDKQESYFVVKGNPGLSFSWEIKVKQYGYEYERLEIADEREDDILSDMAYIIFGENVVSAMAANENNEEEKAAEMVADYYESLVGMIMEIENEYFEELEEMTA